MTKSENGGIHHKKEMSNEAFAHLYGEEGRLSFSQRLQALLREYGEEGFGSIAKVVRNIYLVESKSPDAARRRLERAWRKEFPEQPVPHMPKGFWSEGREGEADKLLLTRPATVLPDNVVRREVFSGSFHSLRDYLVGKLPFWISSRPHHP